MPTSVDWSALMVSSSSRLRDATASLRISVLLTSASSLACRDSLTVTTVTLLRAMIWNVSFDAGDSGFHINDLNFFAALWTFCSADVLDDRTSRSDVNDSSLSSTIRLSVLHEHLKTCRSNTLVLNSQTTAFQLRVPSVVITAACFRMPKQFIRTISATAWQLIKLS